MSVVREMREGQAVNLRMVTGKDRLVWPDPRTGDIVCIQGSRWRKKRARSRTARCSIIVTGGQME